MEPSSILNEPETRVSHPKTLWGRLSSLSLRQVGKSAARPLHRLGATLHRVMARPFLISTNPPWVDARGIATGLFVGLGVPFGLQMVVLGALRLMFRFNTLLAFLFTWVANPITLGPMYYGYYLLGCRLMGASGTITRETFADLLGPLFESGYFWQSLQKFGGLGCDILLRWSFGALIVSSLAALSAYFAGFYLMTLRLHRRARKMGITYHELLLTMKRTARD